MWCGRCFYWIMSKETVLTCDRTKEQNYLGRTKVNAGRKMEESEKNRGTTRDRCWELLPVRHSNVAIY